MKNSANYNFLAYKHHKPENKKKKCPKNSLSNQSIPTEGFFFLVYDQL